ncbi:MAG: hypothetical protein NT067_04270 [Candidatus Diapherotrites archaeon]|nr:hypothetical protein [Candidatus Diapherotrites archaeon]
MPGETKVKRVKTRAVVVEGAKASFTALLEEREFAGPCITIRTPEGRQAPHYLMDTYCKYWDILPKEIARPEGKVDTGALRRTLEKKGLEVHGVLWQPNSSTVIITATYPELPKTFTGRIPLSAVWLWKKDLGGYELIQLGPEADSGIKMTKALYNLYRKNKLRIFVKLGLSMPITMARMKRIHRKDTKLLEQGKTPKLRRYKPR